MRSLVLAWAIVVALSANAFAQDTATGTMTVTGTIVSSIGLTIESGGGTFSGGGTATATSQWGNVSKHGTVPAGVTRTTAPAEHWYWTSLSVKVTKANSTSATYTLSALLGTAPPTGVQFALGAAYFSDVTPSVLTATGTYGQTTGYLWLITIQDTVASGTSINNTINFTAVAN